MEKAARRLANAVHLGRGTQPLSPADYLLCPDGDITAAEAVWLVNAHADLPASSAASATYAWDTTTLPTVADPARAITPEQPALVPLAPAEPAAPIAEGNSPGSWAQAAHRRLSAAARGAFSFGCLSPRAQA